MPWVRCAFTDVFFRGDRTSVLFSKSNKPHSEPGHEVKAQKSCVARARFYRVSVGTRWRPRGLCPMPIVSSMQITTILEHNVLSIHLPPMLIVPSMHNTQYTMCHQGTMPPIRVADVGNLSARAKRPHKFSSGAYLLFLRKMCCFCV